MTRTHSHLMWGAGLLIAAIILANKDTNPLPWAIGIVGAIVLVGSGLALLVESDRKINATHAAKRSQTTSTPGATDTQ